MVSKATSLFAIVSTVYLGTLGAILGATALLGTTNLLSRAKSGLKLLSNVPRPATIGCYLSDHAQLVRKSRPMIDISPKSESTCNLSQANHPPRPDSVQRFCEFAQDETTVALDDRCAKAAYAYFVIDLMIVSALLPCQVICSDIDVCLDRDRDSGQTFHLLPLTHGMCRFWCNRVLATFGKNSVLTATVSTNSFRADL